MNAFGIKNKQYVKIKLNTVQFTPMLKKNVGKKIALIINNLHLPAFQVIIMNHTRKFKIYVINYKNNNV